jgi:uncharacterized protein (TIGR02996 family)
MRTFEFKEGTSNKFWSIERKGTSLTVRFGKIGTPGQTQVKEFPDEDRAQKEHDKLVREKTGKGYQETTPTTAAPASLREALEAAIVANPDDLSSHMAYADHLGDLGDPRGEFIRIQLALEDASKPAAERKKLSQQEKKLLGKHGRDWLGELAPFLLDQKKSAEQPWNDLKVTYTFARGWLDSLEAVRFTVNFTRALAKAPAARLLRRLVLADEAYEEAGEYAPGDDIPTASYSSPQLPPLRKATTLGNVRVFQLGEQISDQEDEAADDGGWSCHTDGEAALDLIKRMPRLEELYLLAHNVDAEQLFSLRTLDRLRVLQLYHSQSYPLARLAKNPSLGNLTHLLLHPHALEEDPYIRLAGIKAVVTAPALSSLTHLRIRLTDAGDKGVKEIVASGILKRLKLLDLRHGCVTDKGARLLADCPDLPRLEKLVLTHNSLTDAGIAALRAAGVKLEARNMWRPTGDEYNDQEYLYSGDIE